MSRPQKPDQPISGAADGQPPKWVFRWLSSILRCANKKYRRNRPGFFPATLRLRVDRRMTRSLATVAMRDLRGDARLYESGMQPKPTAQS